MVKEQPLRRPLALAWQLGVVTRWSPTVTVMGANAVKPVPLIVALLPTGPSLGVTLKSGVSVQVPVAEFFALSDTVRGRSPAGLTGTVYARLLKLPCASVVQA